MLNKNNNFLATIDNLIRAFNQEDQRNPQILENLLSVNQSITKIIALCDMSTDRPQQSAKEMEEIMKAGELNFKISDSENPIAFVLSLPRESQFQGDKDLEQVMRLRDRSTIFLQT